ncbi:MAG: sulfotransferase family protein [Rhodothermales bacterium]
MTLIVTGHPRSGTQLLQRLLNGHPDVRLTNEFGCFRTLGVPRSLFALGILGRCWARRKLPILKPPGASPREHLQASYAFEGRFLLQLHRMNPPLVHASHVEAILQSLLPGARLVGDKLPDYVFNLNQFAGLDGVKTVVIYRDVRDVTASYLERLRSGWDRMPVFSAYDTPQKIAGRWVEAVRQMRKHEDEVLVLQYEALVHHPERELERLAQWLEVDAGGFPKDLVRPSGVGSYRQRLSADERAAVEAVAGPAMAALGYALDATVVQVQAGSTTFS